jgi:hypothetical protein
MDWQEVENIESGFGEVMECERSPWTLVRGNGEGYRKRKRLKKLRWTEEARRLASLKGVVPRKKWRKAGRRLESSQKRKRIEQALRKQREFWKRVSLKEESRRRADEKQQIWRLNWKFKELRLVEGCSQQELCAVRRGLETLSLQSDNFETALDKVIEDWVEWDLPWTDHVAQELKDIEIDMGSLTLGDIAGEQESGRRVPSPAWMKTPTSKEEHSPMLADSPRLIRQELERLTLGINIAQTDQSWQEVTAKVRDSLVPEVWRSQFDKEVQIFDLGVVGEQVEAIEAMVELMVMTEDGHKMVEGSWDDQNSPLNKELFSREERRVHMEIDRWRTVLEVDQGGAQPADWSEKYFSFAEEYVEHQQLEKLMKDLNLDQMTVQDDDMEGGVNGDCDGVSEVVRECQTASKPKMKVQKKIDEMFGKQAEAKKMVNAGDGVKDDLKKGTDVCSKCGHNQPSLPPGLLANKQTDRLTSHECVLESLSCVRFNNNGEISLPHTNVVTLGSQEVLSPGKFCLLREIDRITKIPEVKVIIGGINVPNIGSWQLSTLSNETNYLTGEVSVVSQERGQMVVHTSKTMEPVLGQEETIMTSQGERVYTPFTNLSKDKQIETNLSTGASSQASRTSSQAMLTGLLEKHQPRMDTKSKSIKKTTRKVVSVKKKGKESQSKTLRVNELRKFFEPGESLEESTEHAMQVDYEQEKGALVVGRKVAKAGRKKSTGESIGLVQARIEAFLNLSGEVVVNKGRLPKRKWGKVGENMDLASKKQKKK